MPAPDRSMKKAALFEGGFWRSELEIFRPVVFGVQGWRGAGLPQQGIVEIPAALAGLVRVQVPQAGGGSAWIAVIGAVGAVLRHIGPEERAMFFHPSHPKLYYPKEEIPSGLFEILPERRGGPSFFSVFTRLL